MDKEKLTEIVQEWKGQVEPDTLARVLHETLPDTYQKIFNAGHSTATAEAKEKMEKVQGDMKQLGEEKDALMKRIETLDSDKPDVAKVQAEYELALENKERAWQEKYGQVVEKLEASDQRYAKSNIDRVIHETVLLAVAQGLDRDFAEIKAEPFRSRLRQSGAGEVTGAFQSDGRTPLPLSEGQTVPKVFARELLESAPAKFIDKPKQGGANIGNGEARPTPGLNELMSMSDDDFAKSVGDYVKAADAR